MGCVFDYAKNWAYNKRVKLNEGGKYMSSHKNVKLIVTASRYATLRPGDRE